MRITRCWPTSTFFRRCHAERKRLTTETMEINQSQCAPRHRSYLSERCATLKWCRRWLGRASVSLAVLLIPAVVVVGQQPRQPNQPGQHLPRPRMQPGPDQHPHPPVFFKRLRELPPEEQERVMANDRRFQQLPPERQAQIRDNLRHWN